MHHSLVIVFSVIAAFLLQGCVGASAVPAPGELSGQSISVGDRERSYLLYTPANSDRLNGLRPLILVFHGGGGTAKGISKEVGRSLHRIADREGIYVVYPHAIDKMWDFGAGQISESLEVRIDDRAFFEAVLDEVISEQAIDEDRVFATGISRGGQASFFVACTSNRIRAIASVAMPMPKFMLEFCADAPSVGVAVLNGTRDPLVPYDGGQITVGRKERGEVMSTDDTVAFWRARNNCAAEPTSRKVHNSARDRMTVVQINWEQCEHEPVVLYRIEGGGHTWPSGRQYLPRFVVGPVNRDIDGAAEVWSFFSRF